MRTEPTATQLKKTICLFQERYFTLQQEQFGLQRENAELRGIIEEQDAQIAEARDVARLIYDDISLLDNFRSEHWDDGYAQWPWLKESRPASDEGLPPTELSQR